MRRIENLDHIAEGLAALAVSDTRLQAVHAHAGMVPLRLRPAGFESLASIIVSQQVSRASADAIFGRLVNLIRPLTAEAVLAAGEAVFREAGLSRPKQRALLAVSQAVAEGRLDLQGLCSLDAAEAIGRMTEIDGIGPWTAEVYLLACAGHPDIFPARDVALQSAVAHAFGLPVRPDVKSLYLMAESWSPWRGVAARLFWAYYARIKGREGAPPL